MRSAAFATNRLCRVQIAGYQLKVPFASSKQGRDQDWKLWSQVKIELGKSGEERRYYNCKPVMDVLIKRACLGNSAKHNRDLQILSHNLFILTNWICTLCAPYKYTKWWDTTKVLSILRALMLSVQCCDLQGVPKPVARRTHGNDCAVTMGLEGARKRCRWHTGKWESDLCSCQLAFFFFLNNCAVGNMEQNLHGKSLTFLCPYFLTMGKFGGYRRCTTDFEWGRTRAERGMWKAGPAVDVSPAVCITATPSWLRALAFCAPLDTDSHQKEKWNL